MTSPLDFLSGNTQQAEEPTPAPIEPVAEAATVTETAEPTEQPREAPARGADGKFIGTAVPVTDAPQAATAPAEPGHVPITALLDEREKRQALEKQLADFKASQPAKEPVPPEDQVRADINGLRMQNMRLSVEVDHGKKSVQEAYDWAVKRCDEDRDFNAQMHARIGLTGNPYQVAVDAHRLHAELEEFTAWKASKGAAPAPEPAQTQPTALTTPVPRSLATAPGNGGAGAPHVPIGPGLAFSAAINR